MLMMFLGLHKLGYICCGNKMFLNDSETFFVSPTQNLCPQQMLRMQANGETFVSATMCPPFPGPLDNRSLMHTCTSKQNAGVPWRENKIKTQQLTS